MKGKSALFWVLLALGVSCGGCSLLTMGVMLLGLTADTASTSASVRTASTSDFPTGETPDLYPGSPGWLPSGRGVEIPEAGLVEGRPEGLWWTFHVLSDGKTFGAGVLLFLPDGTLARHFRPGSGASFDLAGQRAQRGSTGVGTFVIEDGKITQVVDGYSSTNSFETGSDADGTFFKNGAAKYLPLTPPSSDSLVGEWKSPSSKFVFNEDSTFEMGQVVVNEEITAAAGGGGTWALDGYLVWLKTNGGPSWMNTVGMSGESFLIQGTTVYSRVR